LFLYFILFFVSDTLKRHGVELRGKKENGKKKASFFPTGSVVTTKVSQDAESYK